MSVDETVAGPPAGSTSSLGSGGDSDSGTRPSMLAAPEEMTRVTLVQRLRSTAGVVTTTGWVTATLSVGAWALGWWLGWHELMVVASVAALCLVISFGFLFGSTNLAVDVEVRPQRVVVGRRAAGQINVVNPGSRRSLPVRMELLVGQGAAEFEVPSLAGGSAHEELFVLPTHRRGVIPVGPATTVKGDPLGLLRRAVPWTDPVPLFVHPRTVSLGHLGAGYMRDLEGQPTADLSPSDIAFHALREYESGDDRRFVHWMTTARVGKLMVRQFTDTRRAHLAVVIDGSPASYRDADAPVCDEFELAVSIAGSLGVRAISDQQDVSMIAAGRQIVCSNGPSMLDGLAGAALSGRRTGLADQVERLNRAASGVSLAVIVTGSQASVQDLRGASLRFSIDVRTIVIKVDPGGATGFRPLGSCTLLTVSSLDEVAHLLWAVTPS